MANVVRVWVLPEHDTEHFADPPSGDTTTRQWDGETYCGVNGDLRWVHWEVIDEGRTCEACAALAGTYKPPLEGDYPGPP